MKLYKGYDVFNAIADKGAAVRAAVSGPYVVVWPAPEPFMLPMLPAYAYVFSERLTTAPHKWPGGCYTLRRYRVSADACKLPRKYRDILIHDNYLN